MVNRAQRIEWFDLAALPSAKETDGNASKFWSVLPFVGYA